MSVSRRGLFGLLAVAPVAAVKVAQEPTVIVRPGLTFVDPTSLEYRQWLVRRADLMRPLPMVTWTDPDYQDRLDAVAKADAELWKWLAGPDDEEFANTGQPPEPLSKG